MGRMLSTYTHIPTLLEHFVMSETESNSAITELDHAEDQPDRVKKFSLVDLTSYSTPNFDGNSVSFVNISYTVQPNSFLAYFKKIPVKKILDNVR